MFKTNEYFNGDVVSMALNSAEGKATVGVMAAGEYEFGTSTVEIMTVISGALTIQQPGETECCKTRDNSPLKGGRGD